MWFVSSVRQGIETRISFLATKRKVSACTRVLGILCYELTTSEQVCRPVISYKDSPFRKCNPGFASQVPQSSRANPTHHSTALGGASTPTDVHLYRFWRYMLIMGPAVYLKDNSGI